jgi:diadenosine tetraphosphate (Ap4A) HIT family hydrolase
VLERLWNGWRAAYVQSGGASTAPVADDGPRDTRSLFTQILESGLADHETHIIHRSDLVFSILNAFPYAVGHVLVLPVRQVADLERLSVDEAGALWSEVTDVVRAVKSAYAPEGLNVGLNLGRPAGGSQSDHLHVHVVPRWTGDVNFMTAVANTRTLPEALPDTARRLREAWPTVNP